LGKAKMEEFDI